MNKIIKKFKLSRSILIGLLSYFFVLSGNLQSNISSTDSSLESFQEQLKTYKPNAPWVMQELLDLNLKEFFVGLETVIFMLAQKNTISDYFNLNTKIYYLAEDIELLAQAWWQCSVYEMFLKNIYYNKNIKQLDLYNITKKEATQRELISIVEVAQQLDIENDKHHPLFIFYAFYCDCLVNLFSYKVKLAYANIDNLEQFNSNIKAATYFQKQIKEKVSKLKSWSRSKLDKMKFEAVYKELSEKNQSILKLLKDERKGEPE